jgi:hypothetical protein
MGLSCNFRIRLATSARFESGGGDAAAGQGAAEPIVACVGDLFECQYQLLEMEGEPSPVRPGSTAFQFTAGSPADHSSSGERRPATSLSPDPIRVIEHSLLWQTSGKGDRDFGIHFFERRRFSIPKDPASLDWQLPYQAYVFRAVCPPSPLTYRGQLVAIDWLVRVRVFLRSGREQSFERPFVLVPALNRVDVFQ